MTGLVLNCRAFSFEDRENSTKPEGISSELGDRQLTKGSYQDKVVILGCIEETDKIETIEKAAEHVNNLVHQWHHNNTNLIVMPFAHLSSNIALPPKSYQLIKEFIQQLKDKENAVEPITFGSHKEWMVDVYGYPRATSWFKF